MKSWIMKEALGSVYMVRERNVRDMYIIEHPNLYSDSIEKHVGCSLPWHKGNNSLQNCSTGEDLQNFYKFAKDIMYQGENNYFNKTQCRQPCDFYTYRAKQVFGTQLTSVNFVNNLGKS